LTFVKSQKTMKMRVKRYDEIYNIFTKDKAREMREILLELQHNLNTITNFLKKKKNLDIRLR